MSATKKRKLSESERDDLVLDVCKRVMRRKECEVWLNELFSKERLEQLLKPGEEQDDDDPEETLDGEELTTEALVSMLRGMFEGGADIGL